MFSAQAEGTIRGSSEAQPLLPEPTIPDCTIDETQNCILPTYDILTKDDRSRGHCDQPDHILNIDKSGSRQDSYVLPPPSADDVTEQDELTGAQTSTSKERRSFSPVPLPVPYMEHSKPAVVEVGQIGKISLLENIAESRFYESVAESSGIKKSKISNDPSEPSVLESRCGHSGDNEIMEGDLKTSSTETGIPERETSHKTQIDAEEEEEKKLRAIAMLRIYTHRLATPRRGSKRRKQSSPSVVEERRSASARSSRPSGANRCGRAGEEGGYRRVTKSAHKETRSIISV